MIRRCRDYGRSADRAIIEVNVGALRGASVEPPIYAACGTDASRDDSSGAAAGK